MATGFENLFDPSRLKARWGAPPEESKAPVEEEKETPTAQQLFRDLDETILAELGSQREVVKIQIVEIGKHIEKLFPMEGDPLPEEEVQATKDRLLQLFDQLEDLLEALQLGR